MTNKSRSTSGPKPQGDNSSHYGDVRYVTWYADRGPDDRFLPNAIKESLDRDFGSYKHHKLKTVRQE